MRAEQQAGFAIMERRLLAVVTGSNTGIGLEIVRGIAAQGVVPVLTARDVRKGQDAVSVLREEGLQVLFHQLDVTSPESVDALAAWIQSSYGSVDILVNNAGVSSQDPNEMMQTNYHGLKRMTKALAPLMRNRNARIINISSVASRLDMLLREDWKRKLVDVDSLQEQTVDKFVSEYLEKGFGRTGADRWTSQVDAVEAYSVSKMAVSAYSRVCSKEMEDVLVCCACPGFTCTNMTNDGHSAKVGADNAVWLATSPAAQLATGSFYVNRHNVGFVNIPLFLDGKMLPELSDYIACMQKHVEARFGCKK